MRQRLLCSIFKSSLDELTSRSDGPACLKFVALVQDELRRGVAPTNTDHVAHEREGRGFARVSVHEISRLQVAQFELHAYKFAEREPDSRHPSRTPNASSTGIQKSQGSSKLLRHGAT